MSFGFWALIPVIVILVLALITKDTFISLFLGVVVGFVMIAQGNPVMAFNKFIDALYTVMCDSNTAWVLMICALFSSVIFLITESGGVLGFSNLAEKVLKTRKQTMIGTWILGLIVFVDDYLNCLAVGAAVRKIADRQKISREMIAFIVNATGVTMCAIVPFSSWSAFMGGLMQKADMLGGLSVTGAYIHTIPYVIYGWLAIIVVPLICLKVIPLFGPMKKAEQRAMETGEVQSPEAKALHGELPDEELKFKDKKCRAVNFLLPILVIAIVAVWRDDLLIGVFAGLLACLIMYLPQRLMNINQYFNGILQGITDMCSMLVIIIMSYVLIEVNSQLGLVDTIVGAALKTVNPSLLPVTIFVVIGLLSFASGTFWGLAAIAFPIVGPLGAALGVSPFLCAGAVISAVAFGGQICMYSDTVMLTSSSTQITNAEYLRTSGPLVVIPFVLAVIGFTIVGFVAA
ncbi:Na+/H+ antiporter NhaC family protein [Aminicella lysinilytica]|uniref:Na+/H+ antiporter NhaC family protein n=1 Tax=Aminicella lysinilytica TaxID=433323 RepID=UPI0026EAC162|nr:Na+/H+ antiporter NhaC family protein [Aminicella lysinilytica]